MTTDGNAKDKLILQTVRWHRDSTAGDDIPTCMLHSYTKAALTALEAQEGAVDTVWVAGASGAAFRIWAHKDLCPSATSVNDWFLMPAGIRDAGWNCEYYSRVWHEESVAEERRAAAHKAIIQALNEKKVPVSWDISVPEWGVIIGYDDEAGEYSCIDVFGNRISMKYEQLGKREILIMSVSIIGAKNGMDRREALIKSLDTAVRHATQKEWGMRPDYQDGLPAYTTWADALERLADNDTEQTVSNYYAGTYLAARHYAHRYVKLAAAELGHPSLQTAADAYARVEEKLAGVWTLHKAEGRRTPDELRRAAELLREALAAETEAIDNLRTYLLR